MDFYQQAGKMALGTRLRRLSEKLMADATQIYALYEVPLDPKWLPVFYMLSHQPEASITEIAQSVGHSHPSISQIVKEMKRQDLVTTNKSAKDARVNVARLSEKGRSLIPKAEKQFSDVAASVEALLSEAQYDLWKAVEEAEYLLSEASFYERVKALRKRRETGAVEIVDYTPQFAADFKRLNYEWIEQYFVVEETDRLYLENPEEKILQPGGHIFMAQYRDDVVGTCALVKLDENTYELAKMGVTANVRGKGIGWLLGQAAVTKARAMGAQTLFLESNTRLEPAIQLYKKLGFKKITGEPSPYERCNIQMRLEL
ncbi:MAG: bifunctional helix-turn-helix transcriptional regulator/GNAT family N-acetyltransferase [Cyanobacteria bacterium J06648_16]